MMYYKHSFNINSPLSKVVDFHRSSLSLKQITPPPIIVRIHQSPKNFQHGELMDFSMWIGPFPIRWLSRIENPSNNGFVDIQEKGPFTTWIHKHTFLAITPQTTQVIDEIKYSFKENPFWYLVGKIMAMNLNFLFSFREWKTKRILMRREL
jgi:ligand-binding SRPBCC domain-containing protein